MKKIIAMLLIFFISLGLVSCKGASKEIGKNDLRIGYISLEDNTLYLDEFEWITSEDKERVKELGLSQQDMPNGYYIYNETEELVPFEINEKTVYNFFDVGNLFVLEDEDKKYSTTNKEEFIEFLYRDGDKPIKLPFWVEVKDRFVKSITEEFVN